ncbi:histidine kinase [Frigoribacterium sp. 2-23]|uniref:sensor histidine kinase n=1 Tax=Frigoribacterium sp. 2-23 TaxID=3415006 RepID=UPI003C6F301E
MIQENTITAPRIASGRPTGGYGRRWRETPRELGYLALSAVLVFFVGLASAFVLAAWDNSGSSLTALVFLAVVLFCSLWVARWFGVFEVMRLRWAIDRPIRPVDWTPNTEWGRSENRLLRAVSVVANPHYWLHLLYLVVVFPIVAGFTTLAVGALLVSPLVLMLLGIVTSTGVLPYYILGDLSIRLDLRALGVLATVVGALVFTGVVLVLPYVLHGFVVMHQAIAAALLGGFRSEQLEAELADREISRTAALSAEGTALRRLERDIHDGPQQRLVRLQMDLGAASRAVNDDPEKARGLIDEALVQSREALEELRALSRGFAPPLLLDRGLVAALESLVDRSSVPMVLINRLPGHVSLPADIERNAYFIASELVTNIGKHSQAAGADLVLRTRVASDGVGALVEVVVTDDGRGGAGLRDGHGLAGVQERLVGLGGFLDISSPAGGPTIVTVSIPIGVQAPVTEQDQPTETQPTLPLTPPSPTAETVELPDVEPGTRSLKA